MFSQLIVDYCVAEECRSEEAWYMCYKCGKCGRKFEDGVMVDSGGTTPRESDEE